MDPSPDVQGRPLVSWVRIAIFEEVAVTAAASLLPRRDAMKSCEGDAATRTVDLVVTGDDRAALAAAVDAVQRGRRVLVVLRSGDARAA
jgi:hypothetical protein